MPSRLTSSDEPPALTNGSGMPLVGSSPSTTLMLKNAWNAIITVMPDREERAEPVRRARRGPQPAPAR